MGRRSILSNTLVAAVRRHFGIPQEELARFLGVSQGQLANVEAGRRGLSSAVLLRLNPLAALLPETSPNPSEPPPALALPAAPAPGPLEARRDYCAWKARNLRYELRALDQRAAVGLRWQPALPALLAALPPAAPDAPDLPAPDASPATRAAWVRFTYPRLLAQQWATAFTPDDAARHYLLRPASRSPRNRSRGPGRAAGAARQWAVRTSCRAQPKHLARFAVVALITDLTQ